MASGCFFAHQYIVLVIKIYGSKSSENFRDWIDKHKIEVEK